MNNDRKGNISTPFVQQLTVKKSSGTSLTIKENIRHPALTLIPYKTQHCADNQRSAIGKDSFVSFSASCHKPT
ncbi:MAG: hypothetical protein IJ169_07000 [Paludibacteraceae bacterium]|nr:hypothetical protein [Paludibacteraceae bacterium]